MFNVVVVHAVFVTIATHCLVYGWFVFVRYTMIVAWISQLPHCVLDVFLSGSFTLTLNDFGQVLKSVVVINSAKL